MTCPKCRARLRSEQAFSSPSSLTRQGGRVVALISGVTCWRCGYWRDTEVAPVMAGIPSQADEPRRNLNPVEKLKTHHVVVRFFDSILAQRAAGAGWFTVAKLLTKAGHRCQEKTLQKHFLLEQGKRCGDGKKQTA